LILADQGHFVRNTFAGRENKLGIALNL
jgi:hypothetical protein